MRALYKIVHTSSRTSWGDPEKRIFEESIWMESQGHQVVIITPKESPLFLKAREKGITVYPISFHPLAQVGEYHQLKHIFTNEQPFVVNSHGRADARIALKAAKKIGVACRIIFRHTGGRLKNTWSNKKIYKNRSHYVFTTAKDTTRHLQKLFNLTEMQIFSIPDGVTEPQALRSKDEARKKLAAAFDLSPEARFIGFPCQTEHPPPLETVLRAFKQILPGLSHDLVITNKISDTYREKTIDRAREMDIGKRIHFHTPETENGYDVYRAIDCCIVASAHKNAIYEGVPIDMMEAMYASCPVIGTSTYGITDLLSHKKTGLLFNPQSHDELSKMISQTLDGEAATLERAYAARKQVKKHHTIDAMGRDIIRIYRLHQVRLERRFRPN